VADMLRDAGVEWWVAGGWNPPGGREDRGVFVREYLRTLRRGPWDVAVFQFCIEASVVHAGVRARLAGVAPRRAVWVQHSQMAVPGRLGRYLSRLRLLRLFVDRMILLSGATHSAVVARGWPAGRAVVIPNGIPVPDAQRTGWLRAELSLPADAVVLVSVGSLIRRKGHDILISAVGPLLGGPRFLLIAGDGDERAALMAQAEAIGVAPRVRFLGLRNDIPDVLADSDLFVLASRAEGLTLAVVEAMAAGLPVVVTDVGGHKEVVTSETGVLVPAEDVAAFRAGVERLLADEPAARRAGEAGRQLVRSRYSLDAQVEAQYHTFAAGGVGAVAYLPPRSDPPSGIARST
jgi:glycosyltransferase involved in cell wall biosynthesis